MIPVAINARLGMVLCLEILTKFHYCSLFPSHLGHPLFQLATDKMSGQFNLTSSCGFLTYISTFTDLLIRLCLH